MIIFPKGSARFKCFGAAFDGSTDYLLRGADLTGDADGKKGAFSCWIKCNVDGVRAYICGNTTSYFHVERDDNNKIYIYGYDVGLVQPICLQINSSAVLAADGWTHILASWDLGATTTHLYINDTSDKTQTAAIDDTIDYTGGGEWGIGGKTDGTRLFNGDIAELWFSSAAADYLDFSVEANRRKFISANGYPVDLGADGSTPTGNQPIVYESLRLSNAASVFNTNKGSGGNFTDQGSIALASTYPRVE